MSLYNYLCDKFGKNNPFFTSDIEYMDYSKPWIYKELNKLCGESKIIRFERGLYYIPEETIFGPSILNPNKIIEKKYIGVGDSVYGIYGGTLLLNSMGVTTQVPNVIEIFTNNEKSRRREVMVGYQKVISRMPITAKNVELFRLLEFFNSIDLNKMDKETSFAQVVSYIRENGLGRNEIIEYAQNFPAKAVKNLLQSGVLYEIA